jgi:hypothetical protein
MHFGLSRNFSFLAAERKKWRFEIADFRLPIFKKQRMPIDGGHGHGAATHCPLPAFSLSDIFHSTYLIVPLLPVTFSLIH